MSLVYWLSKFSREAMLLELFLIGCIATAYFGYLLLQKRRYGVAKNQIPDHVVRAFLVELLGYTQGFKNQLFGEEFKIAAGQGLNLNAAAADLAKSVGLAAGASAGGADPAELAALKQQLLSAIAKQEELNKTVAALNSEKATLQNQLKNQPTAVVGSGDSKELLDKISKLESKLAEYEVIEDDLANLKKYQQENKQLKAQLEGAQKGGAAPAPAPEAQAPAPVEQAPAVAAPAEPEPPAKAPEPEAPPAAAAAPAAEEATTVAATPAEPAAEASPIAAAEESVTANQAAQSFEGLVDKVEESLAPPVGASATDPVKVAEAQTTPPATDAAAPAAPKQDKSDADLLNEFERMLSS